MNDEKRKPPATAPRPLHVFVVILALSCIPLALSVFGNVDEGGRGNTWPPLQNTNGRTYPNENSILIYNGNRNSNLNTNGNVNARNTNTANSNYEVIPQGESNPVREQPKNARVGGPSARREAEEQPRKELPEEGRVFPRPKSFDDDLKLREWLGEMAKERLALIDIVCLEGAISLFTFQAVKDANISYTYEQIAEPLSETNLKRRIEVHPKETFVGVYKLREDRYLLVFRVR